MSELKQFEATEVRESIAHYEEDSELLAVELDGLEIVLTLSVKVIADSSE